MFTAQISRKDEMIQEQEDIIQKREDDMQALFDQISTREKTIKELTDCLRSRDERLKGLHNVLIFPFLSFLLSLLEDRRFYTSAPNGFKSSQR